MYEFWTLPFSLASATRVFMKLLRPIAAAMRLRGIRLIVYLDNILILDQEEASLRLTLATVAETLSSLEFVINNIKKSIFEPAQTLDLLGFSIDSQTMTIQLLLETRMDHRVFSQMVLGPIQDQYISMTIIS